MRNKKILLLFALLWTVLITILSLITVGNIGGKIALPHKDKMIHFVFYFVFVLLWFHVKKSGNNYKKTSVVVFLIAIGYGLLMELFQSVFTTTRKADIFDVIANSSGALAGLFFISYRFLNKT
ncbi:MAG: VanZ family protein [Bacteroidota bacterium]